MLEFLEPHYLLGQFIAVFLFYYIAVWIFEVVRQRIAEDMAVKRRRAEWQRAFQERHGL